MSMKRLQEHYRKSIKVLMERGNFYIPAPKAHKVNKEYEELTNELLDVMEFLDESWRSLDYVGKKYNLGVLKKISAMIKRCHRILWQLSIAFADDSDESM